MTTEEKESVDVGKSLRILMAARNVSNRDIMPSLDLKSPMGVTYYRKQKILNGKIIQKIADYFEISVPEFLNLSLIVK